MPTPAVQPPLPKNLGAYLDANAQVKVEQLADGHWAAETAARELLKGKGIDDPTTRELVETQSAMLEAIRAGAYRDFVAPIEPRLLRLEDNVNERRGNVFGEKSTFSASELEPANLKAFDQRILNGAGFESGIAGMLLAATFINSNKRHEGDFTEAYGDAAWRGFLRARHMLESIPKGKLLESLSVDTLIQVNRDIHAPDEGLRAKLNRFVHAITMGRFDKGGRLRQGPGFTQAYGPFTDEQVEHATRLGVRFIETPMSAPGARHGFFRYPDPKSMRKAMQQVIDELRADLQKPEPDVLGAAASFQQKLVALHPFEDSNGRTSRLVMNRILAEYDFPPAILADSDRDIVLSPEEQRYEVQIGVARSRRFLAGSGHAVDDHVNAMSKLSWNDPGIGGESTDKPVSIDGMLFDVGRDGFLYNPSGRPHLVFGNEVVPLGQLEHYVMARRLGALPTEQAKELLQRITGEARALHGELTQGGSKRRLVVLDDDQARKADATYTLRPHRKVAELLVELTNIDQADPARLFFIPDERPEKVAAGVMSRYQQIDLELWYVERGLRGVDADDLAHRVREQRAKLFTVAKQKVEAARQKATGDSLGFTYRYEKLMWERSPLRFATLREAIDAEGDDSITVWRGDYSIARFLGMAPNNDPRQPDAKAVAKQRFKDGAIGLLWDELNRLEGSAIGRQYISLTTDLGLLTASFADSQKAQTLNLSVLPGFLARWVSRWAKPEKAAPEPGADAAKAPASGENDADRVVKDSWGVPGTLFELRLREANKLEVKAQRKAFELRLDKDALLPGVRALGSQTFSHEQEVHGLERVYPWQVKGVYTAKEIGERLVPEPKPDATTTPA